MTVEVIYTEANGAVRTAEVEADSLIQAEAKFKEVHPGAVYWEIGMDDADFDFNSAPHPSAHYERGE